jgi:cation diffusion facilitator family transporter
MRIALVAALTTMAIKGIAAWITGSVGLLSDALESGVNLVAAAVGLIAIRAAGRPPDRGHNFGHGKAEYLSAALEGAMIFAASGAILWTASWRLVSPQPLEQPGLGLALSSGAALINLAVGLHLIRLGRTHRSIAVVADGKHLLTDVWTSAGVLAGLGLALWTGWHVLDPVVALLVGMNILRIGVSLLGRSVRGLLDASLSSEEIAAVQRILARHLEGSGVDFSRVMTRDSGRQRFVQLTMRVPGDWSVEVSHALASEIEREIAEALPGTITFTHVEPAPTPLDR